MSAVLNQPVQPASVQKNAQRFWMIPGKNNRSRWIVPDDPALVYRVLKTWRPYDPLPYIKWKVFLAAVRLNLLSLIPGLVPLLIQTDQMNWEHAGLKTKADAIPVIYVGSPTAASKLVAIICDSHTRQPLYVAKIPLGPAAAGTILHEASILAELPHFRAGIAPHLLYHNPESGIAVQSYAETLPYGRKLTQHHVDWLLTLLHQNHSVTVAMEMEKLREKKKKLLTQEDPRRNLLDSIACRYADRETLPGCWVHGDFSPWNLNRLPNGDFFAVDWEESIPQGLPFHDLVHYYVVQSFELGKPLEKFSTLIKRPLVQQYLDKAGINRPAAEAVYYYFLLHFWLRLLEQDDPNEEAFYRFIKPTLEQAV